ncbi:hypothetical protein ACQKII_16190 [Lysinibacillus sp. NPDC048646]|uniref:hypothetical protein n=1 Tax=Lysinibacillus sp. NPDC048646 TaxID=3390574 RepID=UPI003D02069C
MNTWDQRFKQQEYVYGTEANEFIRQQSDRFPTGSTIAAYAKGEGRNAVYVASLGPMPMLQLMTMHNQG